MQILIRLFRIFSRTERLIFIAACLIFIVSAIFVTINFLRQNTNLVPVFGGEYIEGLVGQPAFINPVLANNEVDRDLTELVFSNLLDLAENYKMSENGQAWNIRLKENLFWDDGVSITSDDVIFTIKTVQDPNSHSPLLSLWQGVNAERISEREIKLTLPETYVFFENTLRELKIIPKHVFGSIPAANFRLSDYNLEPVGNGPFKFLSFQKERSGFISEYQLVRNEYYFGQKPYLEKIGLKFYPVRNGASNGVYQNEEELIKNFNLGVIDGFGGLNQENLSKININHQVFELRMPRYYAIFFNPYGQEILKDKNVRLALNYATNKKELIEKVFDNKAVLVNGPLVLGMQGYDPKIYRQEDFSLEKVNQILEVSGWQLNPEGVREKKNGKELKCLEFNLVVPEIPFLVETAKLVSEDWSKIGVKLNLVVRPSQEVSDEIIKTRNYEMILFGNIFGNGDSPDLSSFWHSSERFYPGLNLALYENKTADSLIQSIRKTLNNTKRQADLSSFQSLIIQDLPAIFLYSPHYLYVTKNWLKSFDEKFVSSASNRFKNVEKWYIKTARVFR
jgi:peptide/nickel transport system substrate-binding protein